MSMLNINSVEPFCGDDLRRLRKSRGETLDVFASRLGVKGGNISKIETGNGKPSPLLLEKIEKVYKFSTFVATGEIHAVEMMDNILEVQPGGSGVVCDGGVPISERERRILEIIREHPETGAVVEMMGSMDSDTQKDIQLSVQKEKLLRELIKERCEKGAV